MSRAFRAVSLRWATLLAPLILAGAAAPLRADPMLGAAKYLVAFKLVNTTGAPAWGYNMIVGNLPSSRFDAPNVSGTPLPKQSVVNPSGSGPALQLQPPTLLRFRDDVHTVANNGTQEIKAPTTKLVDPDKEVRITRSVWTDQNGTAIASVPVPGFKVAGDPIYTIFNDLEDLISFEVRDLQFLSNVPEIPLSLIDPGNMSGFGPTESPFVLAPNASMDFSVTPDLDPGMWLYAQGDVYSTAGDFLGSFLHGYQRVPEPTTLVLLTAGAAYGALGARRRRSPA